VTKAIAILIVVVVCLAGWQMFVYWDKVNHEEETQRKEASSTATQLQILPGLPQNLDQSLRTAQSQGEKALGTWLKNYGSMVQDPRKAWIELDYCQLLMRDNPAEARKLFNAVKDRIAPSSPVWPRIKESEKSFQ
jgi:hypothetical protein